MIVILKVAPDMEEYLTDALQACEFEITKLLIDNKKYIQTLMDLKMPYEKHYPEWDNIKRSGADVQKNKWGKKYDKNAARHNDEIMVGKADAAIVVYSSRHGKRGVSLVLNEMTEQEKQVFVFDPDKDIEHEYGYNF